jgi:hypothetical protein
VVPDRHFDGNMPEGRPATKEVAPTPGGVRIPGG